MVKANAISLTAIEKAIMGDQHDTAAAALDKARQNAELSVLRAAVSEELEVTSTDDWGDAGFARFLEMQAERRAAVAAADANLKSVTPENGAFSVASQYAADSILSQLAIAEQNDKVDTARMRAVLSHLHGTSISIEWADDATLPELRFVVPETKKRGTGNGGQRNPGNRNTSDYRVVRRSVVHVRVVVKDAPDELWTLAGQTPRVVAGSRETDLHIPARQYHEDGTASIVNAPNYAACIRPFMEAFAIPSGVAKTTDMVSTADGGYYQRQRVIPGSEVTDKNRDTGRYTTDAEGNTHSPDNAPTDWFRCYRIPNPHIGGEMRDYEVSAWLLHQGASAITFYNAKGECVSHTELLKDVAVRDMGGNGKVGLVRPFVRGFSVGQYTNALEHNGKSATITEPARIDNPDWMFHPEADGDTDTE